MIASVTGCSTWMRAFISRKKKSNVVRVDQELDRAGAAIMRDARPAAPRRALSARGRRPAGRAPAPPRPASGSAAGSSNRGRRDGRRARRRRAPAPRHGALRDESLDIDSRVAERGLGLGHGRPIWRSRLGLVVDPLHPPAAAAGDGLDQQRIAGLARPCSRFGGVRSLAARNHRQSGLGGDPPRVQLVAHRLERRRGSVRRR